MLAEGQFDSAPATYDRRHTVFWRGSFSSSFLELHTKARFIGFWQSVLFSCGAIRESNDDEKAAEMYEAAAGECEKTKNRKESAEMPVNVEEESKEPIKFSEAAEPEATAGVDEKMKNLEKRVAMLVKAAEVSKTSASSVRLRMSTGMQQ
jgi:hypothetical protein